MAINDSDLFVVGTNNGRQAKSATGTQLKEFLEPEFVNVSGDTMSGELNVQYPTGDDNASSKEYVDEEIFKLKSALDDIGVDVSNGSFNFIKPNYITVNEGEFLFLDRNFYATDDPAQAIRMFISHVDRDGKIQMFDDLEVGSYLKFEVAGSPNIATLSVTGVNYSAPGIADVDVTLHSASSSFNFQIGSVSYVTTAHLAGIDVDDLGQTFDSRYVKLTGDSDIKGTIKVGTSPGSMNITLSNSGQVIADSFEGDGSKLENLPSPEIVHFGPEPSNPKVGDLWWTDKNNPTHYELYVYAEGADKVTGSPVFDWWAVTTHERFPSTYVSNTEPPKEYFKKGDLWLHEDDLELYCLTTPFGYVPNPQPYEFTFLILGKNPSEMYELEFAPSDKARFETMMDIIGTTWKNKPNGSPTLNPEYEPQSLTGELSGARDNIDWYMDYTDQSRPRVAVECYKMPTSFLDGEMVTFRPPPGQDWPIDPDTMRSAPRSKLEWVKVVAGGSGGDFMPLDISTLPELN